MSWNLRIDRAGYRIFCTGFLAIQVTSIGAELEYRLNHRRNLLVRAETENLGSNFPDSSLIDLEGNELTD